MLEIVNSKKGLFRFRQQLNPPNQQIQGVHTTESLAGTRNHRGASNNLGQEGWEFGIDVTQTKVKAI